MRYEYNLVLTSFRVENVELVQVSRDKNYRHSYRNGRNKHGFIYVVRGSMCDFFSEKAVGKVLLSAGDLMFIPKGCAYVGEYLQDNTEIKIVQFDLSSGTLPEYLSIPKKIELPNAGELIDSFFKPIRHHAPIHPFYSLSCLYALLWQIDNAYAGVPNKYKKLSAAIYELSAYPEENRPVAYYAALCDMSEVNFRRLFREYRNQSPIEYRNELRLQNAQIKLQSGEYNVSETAQLCGFSNLSFFIRLYKKKYGHTPKQE